MKGSKEQFKLQLKLDVPGESSESVDDSRSDTSGKSNDFFRNEDLFSNFEGEETLKQRIEKLQEVIDILKEDIRINREVNKEEAKELEREITKFEENSEIIHKRKAEHIMGNFFPTCSLTHETKTGKTKHKHLGNIESQLVHTHSSLYKNPRYLQKMEEFWKDNHPRKVSMIRRDTNQLQLNTFMVQRKIAAENYKQQLLEVEKLCQEEMLRVEHNFSQLKPLTQMVSDWSMSTSDHDRYLRQDILIRQLECISSELKTQTDFHLNGFCGTTYKIENVQMFPLERESVNCNSWFNVRKNLNKYKTMSTESVI